MQPSSVGPNLNILVGDWNGFTKNAGAPWALTTIMAPDAKGTPDGYNWFTTTIKAATSAGDTTPGVHSFAVVVNRDYHKQWGGATINIDGITTIPSFSGTSLGPTNSITLEDGSYYSFRVLDEVRPDGFQPETCNDENLCLTHFCAPQRTKPSHTHTGRFDKDRDSHEPAKVAGRANLR